MPRTILITGASRGIGLELVRTHAAQGHAVIGTARREADLPTIRAAGGTPELLDVDDEASIAALARRLSARPLDVLINNAGINRPCKTLADLTADDAIATFRVNAVAPMLVTRALLPSLRAAPTRAVVHISSIMGSIESAVASANGSYVYRTSKAALNMMNACLARELGPEGFACIVMHPGWVQTDMGGKDAPLSPRESAAGIARVVAGLTPADNGRFIEYSGKPLPW